MANPSEAEVQATWRNVVKILKESKNLASVTATNNWVTMQDAYTESIESDFVDGMVSTVISARANLDAILASGPVLIFPNLQSYARHIMNVPEITNSQAILDRLYDRFVDNSLTVKSRSF